MTLHATLTSDGRPLNVGNAKSFALVGAQQVALTPMLLSFSILSDGIHLHSAPNRSASEAPDAEVGRSPVTFNVRACPMATSA